jgi:hypothetical protein
MRSMRVQILSCKYHLKAMLLSVNLSAYSFNSVLWLWRYRCFCAGTLKSDNDLQYFGVYFCLMNLCIKYVRREWYLDHIMPSKSGADQILPIICGGAGPTGCHDKWHWSWVDWVSEHRLCPNFILGEWKMMNRHSNCSWRPYLLLRTALEGM